MKKTTKYAGIAAITLVALSPVISVVTPSNMITVVQAENVDFTGINVVDVSYPVIYVEEGTPFSELNGDQGTEIDMNVKVLNGETGDIIAQPTRVEIVRIGEGTPHNDEPYIYNAPITNNGNVVKGWDKFSSEYGLVFYRQIRMYFKNKQLVDDIVKYKSGNEGKTLTINGEKYNSSNMVFGNSHSSGPSGETHFINVAQKIVIGQDPNEKEENNGSTSTPKPEVISGTVTTHSDRPNYSIYDDNNSNADHRSLMATSSWHTDRTRIIDGIKQYRVSTHGWVNASDVTYIPDGEMHSKLVVTPLDKPIQVRLSKDNLYYQLQNVDRDFITHRALDRGTTWMVDKIGTDIHGRIYYGVSTNEFIHNSYGVSVVK
ncbi:hypothetical protein [Companilactobacillus kedongensis]|uniref:hypothetical protein n=1 Tax=Companilactobacillus kedongensis TaxID=2486004 RepID=UPI000F799943|nr:hypothetical protein [Companilactobacillus kedongensis]